MSYFIPNTLCSLSLTLPNPKLGQRELISQMRHVEAWQINPLAHAREAVVLLERGDSWWPVSCVLLAFFSQLKNLISFQQLKMERFHVKIEMLGFFRVCTPLDKR